MPKPAPMKYIGLTLLSIVWLLLTLLLVASIIGIFVFLIQDQHDESYWFSYGKRILEGFFS